MADDQVQASFIRRSLTTFLGLFLCLNFVPLLLVSIPILEEPIGGLWILIWSVIAPAIGGLLGIEGPISTIPNGSSDMTWNYLQELCYLLLALAGAVVWVVRARPAADPALQAWFRIVVRYGLALMMFSYGFIKLIPLQFEPLGPVHLARTYGESSPGGLLWTFMGFSPVYTSFTGFAEVLAAALLLSRRTATLGALLAVGVMANVAVMNFCYDVAVKIYSSVFLLGALFLAGQDIRRVLDVFVHNRPTTPADLSAPVLGRRLRIARLVARTGFLLTVAWMPVEKTMRYVGRQAQAEQRPELYGAWEVERFAIDGHERPTTDELRWRQFTVLGFPVALVRSPGSAPVAYGLEHDNEAGTLTLTPFDESSTKLTLQFARPASDELVLTGPLGPGSAEIRLRRVDTENAPLMTNGFHWVIEKPFNR